MQAHKENIGKTCIIAGKITRSVFMTSHRLCEKGVHLAFLNPNKEKTTRILSYLGEPGKKCIYFECDLTDHNAVSSALKGANSEFGRIDLVISMLEWKPRKGEFIDIPDAEWCSQINNGLIGNFYLLKEAIPYLEKSVSPRVIFIATHGENMKGREDHMAYITAKGGIISLTYSAARSLAARGISVNCIVNKMNVNPYDSKESDGETTGRTMMRKEFTPDEVSSAVNYLVSDEANYISGKVLNINSGLFNILVPAAELFPTGLCIGE